MLMACNMPVLQVFLISYKTDMLPAVDDIIIYKSITIARLWMPSQLSTAFVIRVAMLTHRLSIMQAWLILGHLLELS